MPKGIPAPSPVRVWRCPPNEEHFVQILDSVIFGFFVHYVKGATKAKGRSRPCLGEECPSDKHKLDRQWIGYLPADLWSGPEKVWRPIVLQVTEHLEQEFRGVIARGQEWSISAVSDRDRTNVATRGALIRTVDGAILPLAFDVKPVLVNLYHCLALPPHAPNPLPPRLVLAPSVRSAPEALLGVPEAQQRGGTIAEALARRKSLKEAAYARNGHATNGEAPG